MNECEVAAERGMNQIRIKCYRLLKCRLIYMIFLSSLLKIIFIFSKVVVDVLTMTEYISAEIFVYQ